MGLFLFLSSLVVDDLLINFLRNLYFVVQPSVCWIRVHKDVLYEYQWLFELISRSSHKCRNEGYESQSDEQGMIDRKMEKNPTKMKT